MIVGEFAAPTLVMNPDVSDGSTDVVLTVTHRGAGGVVTTLTPSVSLDSAGHWSADPYELTEPGEWVETWVITGAGEGTAQNVRYVDPDMPLTATGSYATPDDYAEYVGAAGPRNLQLLLRRASRQVDSVLLTAVYALTDVTNPNTSPVRTVADELRDATIEQVSFLLERGYTNGLPTGFQSVAIGSVQLSRGYSGAGGDSNALPFGEIPFSILRNAGLTGQAPQTEVGPPANLVVVT